MHAAAAPQQIAAVANQSSDYLMASSDDLAGASVCHVTLTSAVSPPC